LNIERHRDLNRGGEGILNPTSQPFRIFRQRESDNNNCAEM
jgi:hypothetical protein